MRKTVETRPCAEAKMTTSRAFTLLELLIVISIIAILASTVIPNFIGFDTEAKLSATITNLNTLRTRITMYRAKEGEYPVSLNDLLTKTYEDMGVQQPYLDKIPAEMISSKSGNNSVVDMKSDEDLSGEGGWAYYSDKAKVMVNVTEPLDGKWGKSKGQVPAEW
jgi:prepilin-type N-terminal cleavage/methylation domain-containing protein